MMQNLNKNDTNHLKESSFNINNDKQTNKRPAEESENLHPAKKIGLSTTSNSTIQLKRNENFNLRTIEYINNGINQSNMYSTNNSLNLYLSNSTENLIGSVYLQYYNNINQNTYFNGLILPTNNRLVYHQNQQTYKQVPINNRSSNLIVYDDIETEPIKETFGITDAYMLLKKRLNASQQNTPQKKTRNKKNKKRNRKSTSNTLDKTLNNQNENESCNQIKKYNSVKRLILSNTSLECSNILLPEVPRTEKMRQRMEEALEAISYILSETICNNPNITKSSSDKKLFYRSFQSIISERIEKVLMGRPVGSRNDIIDSYLKRYPQKTDTELMALFEDRYSNNSFISYLIHTDDPKQYYTLNMMRLINTKMKRIITVVENMYENSKKQVHDCVLNKPIQTRFYRNGTIHTEEPSYRIQKSIFYDKLINNIIESEFSRLLKMFKNEIVYMILGKETSQAIELNILQKTSPNR